MAAAMWASEKAEQDPVTVLEELLGEGKTAENVGHDGTLGSVRGGAVEGTTPHGGWSGKASRRW